MHTLLEYDGNFLFKYYQREVLLNKEQGPLEKRSLLQTDSITIFQCSLFGTKGVFFNKT